MEHEHGIYIGSYNRANSLSVEPRLTYYCVFFDQPEIDLCCLQSPPPSNSPLIMKSANIKL